MDDGSGGQAARRVRQTSAEFTDPQFTSEINYGCCLKALRNESLKRIWRFTKETILPMRISTRKSRKYSAGKFCQNAYIEGLFRPYFP
jgi:hypothetical protein